MAKGKKLPPNRARFVKEYLIDRNATKAAIRAGYSKKTAKQLGSKLLTYIDVQAAVNKGLQKHEQSLDLDAGKILRLLQTHATYDHRKFFNEDGSAKDIKDLDDESAQAVAGFEFVNLYEGEGGQKHIFGQLRKYKTSDKLRALEMLGKHFQLFPAQKVEVTGADGNPLEVKLITENIGGKQ